MLKLANFPDTKCTWGYKTLCFDCALVNKEKHVGKTKPIKDKLPATKCEDCGKKGELV